jgi:hypothetical protein
MAVKRKRSESSPKDHDPGERPSATSKASATHASKLEAKAAGPVPDDVVYDIKWPPRKSQKSQHIKLADEKTSKNETLSGAVPSRPYEVVSSTPGARPWAELGPYRKFRSESPLRAPLAPWH